jgi:adenylate kinase family enzyme
MRAYLITGNPGSGKSTLAAELSRRGLIALDADDLAFWEDSAGIRADVPADADDDWRLAHRWVWSRARIKQAVSAASGDASIIFLCGIARNQAEILDLFDKVFLLVIDEDTQLARLARPSSTTSPDRTDAMKQQIRDGRPIFQAETLACGAIPLDGTAPSKIIADRLLTHVDLD